MFKGAFKTDETNKQPFKMKNQWDMFKQGLKST